MNPLVRRMLRLPTSSLQCLSYVFSLLRRLSTRRCPHLLIWLQSAGAHTALAAVGRYLLPVGRSAANPPAAVAVVDRWDRRTRGQTFNRCIDPALLASIITIARISPHPTNRSTVFAIMHAPTCTYLSDSWCL